MIDRKRVRNAFGRQACEYETHASVQKRVQSRLLEILQEEAISPCRLLDVGSGTGLLIRALRKIYGDVSAVGADLATGMCRKAGESLNQDRRVHLLAADAEHLPFQDSSFDLVVSTSTFQWLGILDSAFAEAFRVLTPGGLFCFALFGENTLYELRNSYRSALAAHGCAEEDRTQNFLSREDVVAAIARTGFAGIRTSFETEYDVHDDVPSLLRSLKRIGAGNATPPVRRGLAGRSIMLDMMRRYRDDYGWRSGIPATYGIIFCTARKAVRLVASGDKDHLTHSPAEKCI